MKKILLYLALTIVSFASQAQRIPQALITLSTATDIRAEIAQPSEVVQLMGVTSATDGNGGFFIWNSSSTTTDDGFTSFAVTGVSPGRWLRIPNNNTVKLAITITPVLLLTAYTISYGVTLPIIPANIQVQSTSANGALFNYVSAVTTTGFTLNFASVPIGVCTFYILVIKS